MEQNRPLRVGHVMGDDFILQVVDIPVHQLFAFAVWTDCFLQTKGGGFELVEFMEYVPTRGTVGGLDRVRINEDSGVPRWHLD